ncbi:VOC family protein [Rhizorhabdus argentea]|uniref:VOC family protein n=1 Tax=Rhizorhabdus argentea TaxID=1387174 RepID=UPI0030EEB2FB
MYKTKAVMQAGYVVDDLDAAMKNWLKLEQTGPFFVMRDASPEHLLYRGKPADLLMDIAICQAGPIQVELIQPRISTPNVYRDEAPAAAQFFHHQCYVTDDLDAVHAKFIAMGIDIAQEADTGGIRFTYFDTRKLIGCYTEVVQRGQVFGGMCKMIADAAVDWDGSNPIRSLA